MIFLLTTLTPLDLLAMIPVEERRDNGETEGEVKNERMA